MLNLEYNKNIKNTERQFEWNYRGKLIALLSARCAMFCKVHIHWPLAAPERPEWKSMQLINQDGEFSKTPCPVCQPSSKWCETCRLGRRTPQTSHPVCVGRSPGLKGDHEWCWVVLGIVNSVIMGWGAATAPWCGSPPGPAHWGSRSLSAGTLRLGSWGRTGQLYQSPMKEQHQSCLRCTWLYIGILQRDRLNAHNPNHMYTASLLWTHDHVVHL